MLSYTAHNFKLASYLLNYIESNENSTTAAKHEPAPDLHKYTDVQIKAEIAAVVKKLKQFHDPGLTVFQHYRHSVENESDARHAKASLLEEKHVYDKYILAIVKEFCIITIALLVKLEKMHKKGVLCGSISPYNFLYNPKEKECEPCDLGVILSDKEHVKAEQQLHGDLIYVLTDLNLIENNKYLAPELKESLAVYTMQRMLKNLLYEAENRGLILEHNEDIKKLLLDFHQKKVKYTNKAEIYSAGYSINQILSHMLEKLARLGLTLNENPEGIVPEEYVAEADLLLPEEFENPTKERALELLNEVISYIHDLMKEHVEKRDSLTESIEKFKSVLKRVTATEPDSILEKEEEEEHEHEEHKHAEDEEHEEHAHEEHEHEAHEEHEHEEHEHKEHEHEEHAHEEHEHEHEEHEHEEHAHEEHKHEEHKHEEHAHEEHKHEEHEHEEHAHEEHKHEEHKHEEHKHEEHEHEEHKHEEHEHEEHEHADHEEHEEHEHEEHEHDLAAHNHEDDHKHGVGGVHAEGEHAGEGGKHDDEDTDEHHKNKLH